jgi:hypothetical protein
MQLSTITAIATSPIREQRYPKVHLMLTDNEYEDLKNEISNLPGAAPGKFRESVSADDRMHAYLKYANVDFYLWKKETLLR